MLTVFITIFEYLTCRILTIIFRKFKIWKKEIYIWKKEVNGRNIT